MTPPRPGDLPPPHGVDGLVVQTRLLPDNSVRFVMEGPASAVSGALTAFVLQGAAPPVPPPSRPDDLTVERHRDHDWSRALLTSDLVELEVAFPLPRNPQEVATWARRLLMYIRVLETSR